MSLSIPQHAERPETIAPIHACCQCDDACDCGSTDGVCLICSGCRADPVSFVPVIIADPLTPAEEPDPTDPCRSCDGSGRTWSAAYNHNRAERDTDCGRCFGTGIAPTPEPLTASPVPYVPSWARPDSPTRSMSDAELAEFYRADSVAGDCRFALRPGSGIPADLQAVYAAILAELEHRKPKASDKATIAALRAAWRAYADGRAYTVPAYQGASQKARKATTARLCPHCGSAL